MKELVQDLLLVWFVTSPIASYFVRLPLDRSIVTYNRVVFASIAAALIWNRIRPQSRFAAQPSGRTPSSIAPITATRFEIAWLMLSIPVILSVALKSREVGAAAKSAVDAFLLPLLAFHFARTYFDSTRRGRALFLSAIFLSIFLFATGAYEIATGIDVFPYKGSELLRDAEIRVNGPFSADSSFAVISLLLALFLRSARRVFRIKMDSAARLLYFIGLACAVVACLLPLFRSVAIALGAAWILIEFTIAYIKNLKPDVPASSPTALPAGTDYPSRKPGRRVILTFWRTAAAATVIVAILIGVGLLANPAGIGKRLFNAKNVYSRLVTWEVGMRIASIQPLFGIGLSNYDYYFRDQYDEEAASLETELSTRVARGPHSNPIWILSELGIAGLILYLAANSFLLLWGWRALRRAREPHAQMAAACFLALLLAYWIPGLALASGEYSDLNLYSFFLLGLLAGIFGQGANGFSRSIPQ